MNNNFNYYAITINNKELTKELKSIDKVYNFINNIFRFYENTTINIISCERNDLNENIHYHLLLTSINDIDVNDTILSNVNIWVKKILTTDEVILYYDYVKKDGTYKVYTVPDFIIKNEKYYNRAFLYWQSNDGSNVDDYLLKYPEDIKYFRNLDRLYNVYLYKKQKERRDNL